MKFLKTLALIWIVTTISWAQDFVVPLRGPLEMTGGGRTVKIELELDAVLLSSSGDRLSVRPMVFIHKNYVDAQGFVTGDRVNLRGGAYPDDKNPIVGQVSRGERVCRLRDFGDWILVYHAGLVPFHLRTPRWFRPPGKVAWVNQTPGVSGQIVARLVGAKTPSGAKFPFVILPSWVPEGYQASLEDLSSEDRFGPSYRLLYRKGASEIGLQYATGGIGDRWLDEPKLKVTVEHSFLGPITTASLPRQTGNEWSTHWVDVPGLMTATGERSRNGYLGLTFSPDIQQNEIKKVVMSLGAVK